MKFLFVALLIVTALLAKQSHDYATAMNECQKRFSFDVCIVKLS